MRLATGGVAFACAISIALPARAGETDEAVGRMHYDAGQRFYRDGHYTEALGEFTTGYDLTQRPAFLLNIAQTHRRLGALTKAREFYKTFLLLDPESPLAAEVTRLVGDIERELAAQAARLTKVPEPPPPPPPPPRAPSPSRRRIVWTWVTAGLGLAAWGAAGGLSGAARLGYDDLRRGCAPLCQRGSVDSLAQTIDASYAMIAVAVAATAATLGVAIWETRARRRPTPSLAARF